MNSRRIRVVMLAGLGMSSRIMYHALRAEFDIVRIFLENKIPAKKSIRMKIKRLGFLKVMGQLSFIGINTVVKKIFRSRTRELVSYYGLVEDDFDQSILRKVQSINSEQVIDNLKDLRPDAVIVNGTRIISGQVLSSIDAPFINTHMGITPKYRGVHGGYWALANQDKQNCGVTVHLVDTGIDTGGILYQDQINPGDSDNFNTYPVHQIAKAIPLVKAALNDIALGKINLKSGPQPSRLWYHPTLYQYMKYRFIYGTK